MAGEDIVNLATLLARLSATSAADRAYADVAGGGTNTLAEVLAAGNDADGIAITNLDTSSSLDGVSLYGPDWEASTVIPSKGGVFSGINALLLLDGTRAMTGGLDMDGNAITNAGTINGVLDVAAAGVTNLDTWVVQTNWTGVSQGDAIKYWISRDVGGDSGTGDNYLREISIYQRN